MPPSPRTAAAQLTVIALAFGAGWWMARDMRVSPRPGPPLPTFPATTRSVPLLEAENARLRAENRQLEMRLKAAPTISSPTSAPPSPDPLRTVEEATKRPGVTARVKLMTLDGRLDGEFASLFGLEPEEVQTLQTALAQAKRSIEQLIAANMTVEDAGSPPGVTDWHEYRVRVGAFEGGREVYADLLQRFATTLGTERNAIFRTLEDDQLSRYLSDYGTAAKRLIVTYFPPTSERPPAYRVIEQTARDGDPPESFSFRTTQLDTLIAHYGVLVRDLPPLFHPKP